MEVSAYFDSLESWIRNHQVSVISSLIVLVLFFITRKVIRKLIHAQADKKAFGKSRTLYVSKITSLVHFIVFAVLLGVIWEISLSGLSFYFASVFTVVGVGLFANWSILSNMTASVVLFFFFPYKIGTTVRIQDGDNSIEGVILDITMFHIEIETAEGDIASYPNNIAIQKPFYVRKKA